MELHDFSEERTVSGIKDAARNVIMNDLMEYLAQKYETVKKVSSNEFGVIVGTVPDEDGFTSDVTVVVKCQTKNWYDKECAKRDCRRYDLYEEAEAYELEVELKRKPKTK